MSWQSRAFSRIVVVLSAVLTFCPCASADAARVIKNVPYVANGGANQQLDLYLPANHDFPTVLFVHGGSLTSGDKADDDYRGLCEPFAQAGIACATMNYRLFPAVKWPAPEQDTAAAFAWLHSHIATYAGLPSKIFVFGHSSGCLLASLLGTDPRFLEQHKLKLTDVSGVIAMGCRLNSIVDAQGATPDQIRAHYQRDQYDAGFGSIEALNDAVPTNHVNAAMPRFLILIAEAEQINPPILADAQQFIARASKLGAKAEYIVLPGLKHTTAVHNLRLTNDPTFRLILKFVTK